MSRKLSLSDKLFITVSVIWIVVKAMVVSWLFAILRAAFLALAMVEFAFNNLVAPYFHLRTVPFPVAWAGILLALQIISEVRGQKESN